MHLAGVNSNVGNLSRGFEFVSIIHVADRAGVSKSTVSLVINNSPLVSAETAQMVHRAMREIGYTPAPPERRRGRKPRTHPLAPKTLSIGLVTLDIPSAVLRAPLYGDIQVGVGAYLREQGHQFTVLYASSNSIDTVREAAQSALDGLLLLGKTESKVGADALHEFPCVSILGVNTPRKNWCDWIGYDDAMVGRLAAEHLLKQGHRNVVYIGPADWQRARIFAETITAHGGTVRQLGSANLVLTGEDVHRTDWEAMDAIVEQIRTMDPRPTGIFVWADILTPTLYSCLMSKGFNPGRDVLVVTCNNEWPHLVGLRPRPAIVDLQAVKIGRRAAEHLIWRIHHRQETQTSLQLNPRLIPEENALRAPLITCP